MPSSCPSSSSSWVNSGAYYVAPLNLNFIWMGADGSRRCSCPFGAPMSSHLSGGSLAVVPHSVQSIQAKSRSRVQYKVTICRGCFKEDHGAPG